MKIGGHYFEGLFSCESVTDTTKFQFRSVSSLIYNSDNTVTYDDILLQNVFTFNQIKNLRQAIIDSEGIVTDGAFLGNDDNVYLLGSNETSSDPKPIISSYIFENSQLKYIGEYSNATNATAFYVYRLDLENNTYTFVKTVTPTIISAKYRASESDNRSVTINSISIDTLNMKSVLMTFNSSDVGDVAKLALSISDIDYYIYYTNPQEGESENSHYQEIPYVSLQYVLANTQLNATEDFVDEKVFYGKNGIANGTLTETTDLTIKQLQNKVNTWKILNNSTFTLQDSITTAPWLFKDIRYRFDYITSKFRHI